MWEELRCWVEVSGLGRHGRTGGGTYAAAFSWSAVLDELFFLEALLKIWTCCGRGVRRDRVAYGQNGGTDVKLPPLNVLAGVFIRNDDDQLRDLAAHHPPVQLRHDLLDVRLNLVVG